MFEQLVGLLQLILPHVVDNTFMAMDYFCIFDVSNIIPKNTYYFPYVTFKPFLTYICGYDPQTRIHQDVCKRPNIFGVFLDVDPSHLSPGLQYSLRSLGFDLP